MSNENESGIAKEFQRWEKETVEPGFKRSPERLEDFTTVSGRSIKRLYTPIDIEDFDYLCFQLECSVFS